MSTKDNEVYVVTSTNSNNDTQPTSPTSNITMKDQATNRLYTLYVSNSKLTMSEGEG